MTTNNLSVQPPIVKIYGMVRTKEGRPVIDDGLLVPEQAQHDLLTQSEIETLANDRYAFTRSSQ